MADRIEQEFLINASQALNILGRLDAGFQNFENRLRTTAAAVNAFNSGSGGQAFANLNTQVAAAARSMASLQQGATRAAAGLNTAAAQAKNFTGIRQAIEDIANTTNRAGLSFETFARIVQAQVIIRAINSIRDAFTEAVERAGALQKQTALIQTIATAAQGQDGERIGVNSEKIAKATREISDSLNIPQLEVAQGLYNAISNQVGDFAESLTFASEAGRFAKATNSTLAESVDTLSAVLRAYTLNVDQTNRVSDILFATIDKGRVTADDLSNTLGRILPAAAELGVSFEEVGASIATISVGGLTTDETLTQVRATFSGLLKPSDSLKAAFEKVGVASGEVGIRTFGFVGFLNKLRDAAGGTSSELAALFPNVRNLGGVLALTAEDGERYAKTLQEISDTAGLADGAFNIATDTDFEKLTSTANQVQNAMAALGDELLSTGVYIQDLLGGSDNLVTAVDILARSMVRFAPVVGVVTVGLIGASNAARLLLVSLNANPIILASTAIAGLTLAVIEYERATKNVKFDRTTKELEGLAAFDARQIETRLAGLGREATKLGKDFDIGLRETLKGATVAAKEFYDALPEIESGNALIVSSVTDSLEAVVQARIGYVRELERAAKDADKILSSSANRVTSLQDQLSGNSFSRSLKGLNEAQQVFALTERSEKLAQNASNLLVSAAQSGDEQGISRALELFNQAGSLASDAERIAEATDNRALEARAVGAVTGALNKQIRAEETLQRFTEQRAVALKAEEQRQKEIAKNLEAQAKLVLENTSLFNDEGVPFSDQERAQRAGVRDQALGELLQAQFDQGDFDLANILGVAKFAEEFNKELSSTTTEVSVVLADRGQEVADQLSVALGKLNLDPYTQALKAAGNIAIEELIAPEQLEAVASRAEQNFRNRSAGTSELTASGLRQDAAAKQAIDTLQALTKEQARFQEGSTFKFNGGTNLISDEIVKQAKLLTTLFEEGAPAPDVVSAYKEAALALEALQLQERASRQGESPTTQNNVERFSQLGAVVKTYAEEALKGAAAGERLEQVGNADFTGIFNSAINAGTLGTNLKASADNMERMVRASKQLNIPTGQGSFQSFGGFFANGGMTRGVDNIPAMLTAGESVLNSRATSRFFSQIQAMNAGQEPVFRSQGGAVTNIGDINVNVNTTGGGVDGRQIAESLRRELRLNSNSLRR